MIKEKREELAALCHEQWSGWMKYLFKESCSEGSDEGAMLMHSCWVERWQRQMNTPYSELSEEEKNSDRKEADRFIALIEEKTD